MEHVFQMGHEKGDKVFKVSTINWQGEDPYIESYEGWDPHWKEVNKNFEMFLRINADL